MGRSTYSDDAFSYFAKAAKTKSTNDIFKQTRTGVIANTMDPKGITFREARDSDLHPDSTPIMVWLDVTGSMGEYAVSIARQKLSTLMATLIEHGVVDASVFFGAIGDHNKPSGQSDRCPLQVGQFESGADELIKCLTSTNIEKGGGGNHIESYCLAHLFSGKHTSIDSFEKRGKKGFLFTIGDEGNHKVLTADAQKKIFGYEEADDLTDVQMYEMAKRLYHVFHIHVNQADHKDDEKVLNYWRNLVGERLIIMDDHDMVSEIIASTVAVMNGADLNAITSSFDKTIATGVKTALAKVDMSVSTFSKNTGVIAL